MRVRTLSQAVSTYEDALVEPAIEIAAVNHHYGQGELRKQVLFDVNLELMPGEIVIMTGPSGSGKTTVLTLMGTLRAVQEGSVKILGQEVRGLGESDIVRVRRNIGFIFQAHNLIDALTASQNVGLALELEGLSESEMRPRVTEALTSVGLGHRLDHKPQQLSGGQRQRVAIARAIVNKPKIILADEPTAALDKESGRTVVTLLQELAKVQKTCVIIVTHDNRILDIADRLVNMVDGKIASNVIVAEAVRTVDFLKRCSIFAKHEPSALMAIAQRTLRETHEAGATIIKQGDPGDKFYVVRKGSLDVIVSGDAKGILKTGDFFGEASLLTGAPRAATVVAREKTELYSLAKKEFEQAVASSPAFNEELRNAAFRRQRG